VSDKLAATFHPRPHPGGCRWGCGHSAPTDHADAPILAGRKVYEPEDARYGIRIRRGKDGALLLWWLPTGKVIPPHIASIDGDREEIVIRFHDVEDLRWTT
jgi:hypothetical protein